MDKEDIKSIQIITFSAQFVIRISSLVFAVHGQRHIASLVMSMIT